MIVVAIDLNQGSTLVVEEALATALRRGNCEAHVLSVRETQVPAVLYPVTLVPVYGTPTVEDTTKFCETLLAGRSAEGLPPAFMCTSRSAGRPTRSSGLRRTSKQV